MCCTAGLVVGDPNGLTSTFGGALTALAGSGVVALVNGRLSMSGWCAITLNVVGTTASTKNNTTSAVASNEGGTGASASATVTVIGRGFVATGCSAQHGSRCSHRDFAAVGGQVLVVGGRGIGDVVPSSAELYDPVSDTWQLTGLARNCAVCERQRCSRDPGRCSWSAALTTRSRRPLRRNSTIRRLRRWSDGVRWPCHGPGTPRRICCPGTSSPPVDLPGDIYASAELQADSTRTSGLRLPP